MNYRNGRKSFGRGGRGGGRGGRGGGGGGRGRGGHRGRGGRGRGGPRQHRDLRDASISGNKRDRISVESGDLVFIDQFMLANPQFLSALKVNIDADPEVKDNLIKDYGGCVVSVQPGMYRIERDPFAFTIVVHPDGQRIEIEGLNEQVEQSLGRVYVDTRCVAMIDRELLDDSELLSKYQQLWANGEEKACRDLLRDNGGAVRYGFQRYGDELDIHIVPNESIVCLWPSSPVAPAEGVASAEGEAA